MKRWVRLAISIAVAASAAPASASAQDATKGQVVFNACRACHTIGADARNKAGPQLNGIVGHKAAAVPGFRYSDAMTEAARNGLVWTEPKLTAYLESPDTFLPQGVMAFAGVKNAGDLKDLLFFLKNQK
jgi:cytochrome c